tara:strand:- start:162 stop:830 length:669 start_codon:yes stop_codon:yes gene_type:complete
MKYLILTTMLLLSINSYSATDEPHPIIDSNYISKYSYNLESMNIKDLQKTRISLKNYLDEDGIKEIDSKKNLEKKLLVALLEYDDVRIQITNVIDEIIQDYKVNIEIENTLLSFKDTFMNIIKDNRPLVKNLRDYKAYDFRLGSAYLAMMSAFHETEESKKFYSRLVKDKKNDTTSIGKYNKELKLAQVNINLVKKDMEALSEISDIKAALSKIEKEISIRE